MLDREGASNQLRILKSRAGSDAKIGKIYALADSSSVIRHLLFSELWLYRQVRPTIKKKIGRDPRPDQNKDASNLGHQKNNLNFATSLTSPGNIAFLTRI